MARYLKDLTMADKIKAQELYWMAVVVAQMVEQSLPIPEDCGSNPAIGKNSFICIKHLITDNCVLERRK